MLSLTDLSFGLDYVLTEGGANLSFGERQLLSLARVLLNPCSIIVMDEPTSGIDPLSDAKIERLLHDKLAGKTIVTIAHRTETLSRYDRLIDLQVINQAVSATQPEKR